jgi:hypothetical protein
MRKVYTFGMKYSQEKYAANKLAGFNRVKIPEISEHWYGGQVKYLLKNGSVIVFMGEKGTIDAGCLKGELDGLSVEDLKACYANLKGEKALAAWQKPMVLLKLTG